MAAAQPNDGLVECRVCGRRCRSLGHHLRVHGMSPDQYRDQYDIRRTQPLTSPSARQRWQDSIAARIATGELGAHYAANAERAAAARAESHRVLRELRAKGVTFKPARPPRSREDLATVVARIEAGATRADALAAVPISESAFYTALRRHPDLKARMARAAERKASRAKAHTGPGRVAGTELARVIAAINAGHPNASLLYARIAIVLLDAPGRTLTTPDLSEALGKGRDSSAVQDAIARMEGLGVVTRELQPADEHGGRAWAVTLMRAGAPDEIVVGD